VPTREGGERDRCRRREQGVPPPVVLRSFRSCPGVCPARTRLHTGADQDVLPEDALLGSWRRYRGEDGEILWLVLRDRVALGAVPCGSPQGPRFRACCSARECCRGATDSLANRGDVSKAVRISRGGRRVDRDEDHRRLVEKSSGCPFWCGVGQFRLVNAEHRWDAEQISRTQLRVRRGELGQYTELSEWMVSGSPLELTVSRCSCRWNVESTRDSTWAPWKLFSFEHPLLLSFLVRWCWWEIPGSAVARVNGGLRRSRARSVGGPG